MNLSDRASRNQVGWGQYLNDVGLVHRSVHRWLSKYDFDRHELIPDETINLPQEIDIDDVLPTIHTCPSCGYGYDKTSKLYYSFKPHTNSSLEVGYGYYIKIVKNDTN